MKEYILKLLTLRDEEKIKDVGVLALMGNLQGG